MALYREIEFQAGQTESIQTMRSADLSVFIGLMDRCLPNWRHLRQVLNAAPLAHADWAY